MENRNDNNYDEPLNMNPNKSELPNQKNSTIKKIQFYVTMVIGIIFLLLDLFSFFKNILSSEKEEKVVEVEAPKVQKLEKDNADFIFNQTQGLQSPGLNVLKDYESYFKDIKGEGVYNTKLTSIATQVANAGIKQKNLEEVNKAIAFLLF